jgi:hypothetical protein
MNEDLTFEQIIRSSLLVFAREYYEHQGFKDHQDLMEIILKHRVENVRGLLKQAGYYMDKEYRKDDK